MSNKIEYVYNESEVVLTGRTAERKLARPPARSGSSRKVPDRVYTLHEVTPSDPENGSWKKWVRLEELFEIKQDTE